MKSQAKTRVVFSSRNSSQNCLIEFGPRDHQRQPRRQRRRRRSQQRGRRRGQEDEDGKWRRRQNQGSVRFSFNLQFLTTQKSAGFPWSA